MADASVLNRIAAKSQSPDAQPSPCPHCGKDTKASPQEGEGITAGDKSLSDAANSPAGKIFMANNPFK